MSLELDGEARLDLALVQRVLLRDDRQAFAQLMRRHQAKVRAQLRRLCQGDAARADDLAQETFLLVWRKLESFRGDARFSTWLFRIAHHCFLQSHRQLRTTRETSDADKAPTAEPAAAQPLGLQHDLERALQLLPDAERMVLLYHSQLGLSHEETAEILALPLGTVKSHVLRGKARLRDLLQAYQANPPSGVAI